MEPPRASFIHPTDLSCLLEQWIHLKQSKKTAINNLEEINIIKEVRDVFGLGNKISAYKHMPCATEEAPGITPVIIYHGCRKIHQGTYHIHRNGYRKRNRIMTLDKRSFGLSRKDNQNKR